MHIYLDSRDHIHLAEKFSAEERCVFETALRGGSHKLVFSLHNIMEPCASLVQSTNASSVMRMLRRLERIPHVYLAETQIAAIELVEAITSFSSGKEYSAVNPFVRRFDEVVSPFDQPPTRIYLRYSLAETVFDLWRADPTVFRQYAVESRHLAKIREADRARTDLRSHDSNFVNTIIRDLELYNIGHDGAIVSDLAAWVWEYPSRCPTLRLSYEVFHQINWNTYDRVKDSDIADFAHLDCVPYVDVLTLDNRMREYVRQVDHRMGTVYHRKICRDINAVERAIRNGA